MRRACKLLADEASTWPGVSARLMFGFRAIYRTGVVFAMLPDKRSLEVPNSIAYKDDEEWKSFEMEGESGVGRALAVLEKAYARSGI
jgi:hypothetical protein